MSKDICPWPYPERTETDDPEKNVNVPTPEGRLLGEHLAKMSATHIQRMREHFPDERPPCNDCAFVAGTNANQCAYTGMIALKTVMEDDGEKFYCHKAKDSDGDPKHVCAGWIACKLGIEVAKKIESMMDGEIEKMMASPPAPEGEGKP